jgi:hypothetical protein
LALLCSHLTLLAIGATLLNLLTHAVSALKTGERVLRIGRP